MEAKKMQYTNNKTPSEKMREVRGYAIISKGDNLVGASYPR